MEIGAHSGSTIIKNIYILLFSSSSNKIFFNIISFQSGGGGSGGCVITGPYETRLFPLEDYSDESFESTDESDATMDHLEPPEQNDYKFNFNEIVWTKRPALPWFPGIVIFLLFFIFLMSNF
jgi:hypothetical protein